MFLPQDDAIAGAELCLWGGPNGWRGGLLWLVAQYFVIYCGGWGEDQEKMPKLLSRASALMISGP